MNNTTFTAHNNGITKTIRPTTVSVDATKPPRQVKNLSNNYVITGIRFY